MRSRSEQAGPDPKRPLSAASIVTVANVHDERGGAMAERVKVLSIDGGGIRGIIPAMVLAEVERRTERRIADLFDLIAGTSTGGILALALTKPGSDGKPAWRAEELVNLYVREGPQIFRRSILRRVRSLDGALDEKYPSSGLDAALRHYLGEVCLADALTDVLVTAYETERRTPFFFRSARARRDAAYNYPMRLAARATAAAPTYFEALELTDEVSGDTYSLVDGGVFAVNPGMVAVAEVLAGSDGREVLMLSLGTGEHTRPLPWRRIKDWGALKWARPVLDVIFDGVSDTVDFEATQILDDRYWRLQTELRRASDDLDDARPENLRLLQEEASALLDREADTLNAAIAALTADE